MRFAHQELLWLLLLLPLLAFWRGRKGQSASVQYSSAELVRQVARDRKFNPGRLLFALRLLGLACLIVALARPQFGQGTMEIQSSGIDIVLAVDISGSMRALDFKIGGTPTARIEVVKTVVSQFIEDRENDRIGMIVFAGRPYLVSPLTLDHSWLQQNLSRVKIGTVEDGTAIGSAIAASVNRLRNQKSKSKIVVLLTDGVNNSGNIPPETAADAAKALGIKVYTIGAGIRGEAPIPVTDAFGRQRIAMATVDVDEEVLKRVADVTGGKFYRATDTDSLKNIYSEINRLEKTTTTIKKFEHYEELFYWFLIPGLTLLSVEFILAHTWLRRLP